MPKSNLPAHMDSVRQKLRPKHQLLVLKCYPRLPKNSSADVKPNSSELSYLLFYTTTRTSKLQKVGHFLERKTVSDVAHFQSARVTVTLQIITALLDKLAGAESALELIAPYVLRILLDVIIHTNDIGLIEATTLSWDAFCRHQSAVTLVTNQEHRDLFEQVVEQYAIMASKDSPKRISRVTVASHDATRLREIGLHALQSLLATTTNLAIDTGTKLLDLIVPAILSNLHSDNSAYLDQLLRKSKQQESEEKERGMLHRQSLNTIRTYTGNTETPAEVDPRSAEGTTQEADALAEEQVGLLALECLRAVFATESRAQLRGAAVVFLEYVGQTKRPSSNGVVPVGSSHVSQRWATKVFEMSTAWTPVQDRFVVLVAAVELISRLPLSDEDVALHLRYVELVNHILRSDLNLIGLSVMDILLALVQQVLQVLQLPPLIAPNGSVAANGGLHPVTSGEMDDHVSESRLQLIVKLKACIADLATHVYYMDQVSDMIAAILLRLKPNLTAPGQTSAGATAAAIQEPREAVRDVASNVSNLATRKMSIASGNAYFSFDLARRVALEAVKDIIAVANSSRSVSLGSAAENHSTVPNVVWEGTQWLLRDPSFEVRRAYVEALMTWLEHETTRSDTRIAETRKIRKVRSLNGNSGGFARRAASNASRREKVAKHSSFLALLHLAIYENAIQYADSSEPDILLLHSLLTALVQRLGINALHTGLPMLLTLQDEGARANDAVVQVRLGSLVQGYLWTVVEFFGLQSQAAGKAILEEVDRRKAEKWWVPRIEYPPFSLDSIPGPGMGSVAQTIVTTEPKLAYFDRRQDLVDTVTEKYHGAGSTVPPGTPGAPNTSLSPDQQLSDSEIKDPLLSSWSRESCLAQVAASAPKSQSLSGSRSSPSRLLVPNGRSQASAANGHASGDNLFEAIPPIPVHRQQAFGHLNVDHAERRPSGSTHDRESINSSGVRGTVKFEELKRVLSAGEPVLRSDGLGRGEEALDDASSAESMVEIDDADLELESPYYRTPPQSASVSTHAITPIVLPEAGTNLETENGYMGVNPAKSLRAQGYSIATSKKKNVSLLLGRLPQDTTERRAVAMEEPPY